MDTFARRPSPYTPYSAQQSDPVAASRQLYRQARNYVDRGYSVIPLIGDASPNAIRAGSSPKQPAIAWKDYQRRRPEAHELEAWFRYGQYTTIGIVTGAVSSLLVFDFDTPGVYEAFSAACPTLIQTQTVRTARGRHLYFHVAPGLTLPSRKIPGLDIQGEGRYVVAPPSTIKGHCYTVEIDQPPHSLTPDNLRQIVDFLAAQSAPDERAFYAETVRAAFKPQSAQTGYSPSPHAPDSEPHSPVDSLPSEKEKMSEGEFPSPRHSLLIAHYTSLATHLGSRNAALYRLSHHLRRSGHSEAQAIDLLARMHAEAKPLNAHIYETQEQRLAEARRTIASAYESPYAPPIPTSGMSAPLLPGSVMLDQALREYLLQRDLHDGTAFLRVYEGLSSQGIQPGDHLTRRRMTELLQPLGIGRPAIERTLNGLDNDGQSLLQIASRVHNVSEWGSETFNPPGPPFNTDIDSTDKRRVAENPLPPNGVQTPNPTKIQNHPGRPAILYVFPGVDDLCQRLGVRPAGGGDPIQRADLTSPAVYRRSLEHSFIKRRPGQYALGLLAERLGVSERSIQRYHNRTGVYSLPIYDPVAELSLENLDHYPKELPAKFSRRQSSKFSLIDDRGKRYPARFQTAKWLLCCKHKVILMQRAPNLYWVDKPPIRTLVRHQLGSYQVSSFKPNHLQEAAMRLARTLERHFEQLAARAAVAPDAAPHRVTGPAREPPDAEAASTPSPYEVIENLTRAAIWSRPEPQALHQPRLVPDTPPPKPAYSAPERPKRFYRQDLHDMGLEDLAVRLHEFTNPNKTRGKQNNRRGQKDSGGLSMANARRLVEVYGFTAAAKALQRVIALDEKNYHPRNPAGLIIVTTRMNWRKEHNYPPSDQVPKFQAEKRATRRRKKPNAKDANTQQMATDDDTR